MYEYYIVASSSWVRKIRNRHHRLAEHLIHDQRTAKVFWLYNMFDAVTDQIVKRFDSSNKMISVGISSPNWAETIKPLDFVTMLNGNSDTKKILWYTTPEILWQLSSISIWDNIVYDCSNLWFKAPWEKYPNELLSVETEVAKNSKVLFATSGYLADHLDGISKKRPLIIENGVDFKAFQTPKMMDYIGLENVPAPRIGFLGSVNPKINLDLIYEVAKVMPDVSIVLVGPIKNVAKENIDRLKICSNIYCFDALEALKIPSILNLLDVGLLPYADIEYNKAVSPLKFFEYLASGIPIVGCGVPETKKFSEDGIYYYTDGNAIEFAEVCKKALQVCKNEELIKKRKMLAKERDWENIFHQMLEQVI